MIRKYLYLDEDFINDAYATIFGYDHETQEITTNIESHTGGKIGIDKGITAEGSKEKQSTSTTSISAAKTTAAKLQNILHYIKDERGEDIPYYEQLNKEAFDSLNRDDVFEGVFELKFTKIEQYAIMSTKASEFVKVTRLSAFDGDTQEAMKEIVAVAEQERLKGLVCLLRFSCNGKEYPCYCRLNEKFLKTEHVLLQDEVTIVCKVSKIIPQGRTINLTDITELLKFKVPNTNTRKGRTQKVQNIKSGSKNNSIKYFQDEIKGPALEVVPLAIYK